MIMWKKKKIKKKTKKKKSFWKRVRFKYKLSFINESNLEEVWAFRLSQLSAFVAVFVFTVFLISITSIVIIKTPIRNYLPGYLDAEVRHTIIQNALKADSLEMALRVQSKYLQNVSAILTGTVTVDSIHQSNSDAYITANYDIPRSQNEENFVNNFEEEERYNLTTLGPGPLIAEGVFFYKPVNGIISSHYDAEIHHYGVDLVAAPRESVLATLDGTVIYTGSDPEFGNVIGLQHKNGFSSMYKHNEILFKQIGDHVIAGEVIALIGNTGNLSTGPHLHFELWYKGTSVNPEEYIAF
ncbi:MAG: M23 family metallopeptidase [Tannerella sp.]|jgi:lipoprotein NlpD|nr:M23 family metallopeptidase [Tannerella sp.]